jgi:hypothetical protein
MSQSEKKVLTFGNTESIIQLRFDGGAGWQELGDQEQKNHLIMWLL